MVPGPLTSDKNSVTCRQSESKFSFFQRNTKVWNTLRLCQGLASFPRGTRDVSLSPFMGFILSTLCTSHPKWPSWPWVFIFLL